MMRVTVKTRALAANTCPRSAGRDLDGHGLVILPGDWYAAQAGARRRRRHARDASQRSLAVSGRPEVVPRVSPTRVAAPPTMFAKSACTTSMFAVVDPKPPPLPAGGSTPQPRASIRVRSAAALPDRSLAASRIRSASASTEIARVALTGFLAHSRPRFRSRGYGIRANAAGGATGGRASGWQSDVTGPASTVPGSAS
jgi:hypothetical protein